MKLAPGMNVFKIADLSSIWAQVEVYEDQIRYMQPGRRPTLRWMPSRTGAGPGR